MFNEAFSHGSKFTVNTDGFPFVNLSDVIKENGHKTLTVQKVFIMIPKNGASKGKEKAVLVADNHCIYLPDHCISDVKKILDNDEYIEAINNGLCGFATSEYEATNYGGKICYSGSFVDIDKPAEV